MDSDSAQRPPVRWQNRTVGLKTSVLVQAIDDEAVLLDTATETYFELNPVGSWIVDRLEEPCRFEDLISALVEHFDVDDLTACADVDELLDQLDQLDLIIVS